MDLETVVTDVADALKEVDSSGVPFKNFLPGVGPYGEPQLVKKICEYLNALERYCRCAKTKRTPDLILAGHWALEFKIVRPFGDNGKVAENWSVNLLHPYEGNTSLLGDCLKLRSHTGRERKAVIAIGYEHDPPKITLEPLVRSFEVIASSVLSIQLGERLSERRNGLIHPVHQQLVVMGWSVA